MLGGDLQGEIHDSCHEKGSRHQSTQVPSTVQVRQAAENQKVRCKHFILFLH